MLGIDGADDVVVATLANGLLVDVSRVQGTVTVADGGGSLTVDTPQLPAALVAGRLDVSIGASPATVPVSDAGGSLTVDGTVSVVEPVSVDDNGGSLTVDGTVTADTELPAAAALADGAGNPTAPAVGANGLVWNGATWDRHPGNTSGAFAQGNVAHDAPDAGNPLGLGARAIAYGSNPAAVAAADRSVLYANRAGVLFTIGGHPNILALELAFTAVQTDVAIVTVGAGAKIVVTSIAFVLDNATTVDVGFRIGFGATTTPTTTGVILSHPGVVAGGGIVRGDGSGIIGVGADGEDLRITAEVPTSGSGRVMVSYFTIES